MAESAALCDPSEVVALMRAGDLEALDRMTSCYGQRLQAVGRRVCRDAVDAEDVVQSAMESAGRNLTRFRGEGSLEGWLVRMVVHACHRMRRGRKNDAALHDAAIELVSADASPEELAERGEMIEALGRAVEELAPVDRLIVLLAEGQGWTGPEIAEELDLTPGAVRTRLSRSRRRIRERLGLGPS